MTRSLLALSLVFTACDGTDPIDTDTPSTPMETDWQDQSFEERSATMVAEVIPAMQPAFSDYDPNRFDSINCGTCHGDGATDGSFSMPNDGLIALDPTNPQGPPFMFDFVVPEMAALLDTTPFDPATGEGFGCFGCHPAQ